MFLLVQRIDCTLLQILVCVSACAICKCVQCVSASLTVPKGRSGSAKTVFFMHQTSINETIFSNRFFNFHNQVSMFVSVFSLGGNVLWYGVVRDYEAISYQFTPTFFTSRKPSKTSETRMHYTMCYRLVFFVFCHFSINLLHRFCLLCVGFASSLTKLWL